MLCGELVWWQHHLSDSLSARIVRRVAAAQMITAAAVAVLLLRGTNKGSNSSPGTLCHPVIVVWTLTPDFLSVVLQS